MRRSSDDQSEPGACPGCNAKAWVDLGQESTALAYREAEAMDRRQHEEKGHRRGFWIGAVATTAMASALVLWEPALAEQGGVVMLVFVFTWLLTALAVEAIVRRSRPGRARPRRWRHPLPPRLRSPGRRSVSGVAQGDALLNAPLSQEPCLGWTVQVWSDETLLLDEQHHAGFVVDGEAFGPDSVVLELASRELRPQVEDERFARFLQRRGLSLLDPSLRVREACLVPCAVVSVMPGDPVKGDLVLSASEQVALAA
jgi:hypothetical protein